MATGRQVGHLRRAEMTVQLESHHFLTLRTTPEIEQKHVGKLFLMCRFEQLALFSQLGSKFRGAVCLKDRCHQTNLWGCEQGGGTRFSQTDGHPSFFFAWVMEFRPLSISPFAAASRGGPFGHLQRGHGPRGPHQTVRKDRRRGAGGHRSPPHFFPVEFGCLGFFQKKIKTINRHENDPVFSIANCIVFFGPGFYFFVLFIIRAQKN